MKAVGPLGRDFQEEVQLGRRLERERPYRRQRDSRWTSQDWDGEVEEIPSMGLRG